MSQSEINRRNFLQTIAATALGSQIPVEEDFLFDENELIGSVCSESFFEFVKEFWSEVITSVPIWNWHIKFLCDELQSAAERVFYNEEKLQDYIINIPPGTTKSTICSVMWPAWILSNMPSARIICGSHTDTLVLDLSSKTRLIVESDKYQKAFGKLSNRPENLKVEIRDDQNTKGYWATTRGGFRFSCTVGGKTPTGFHGHFLIVDDPIDPQKVMSDAEIKEANEWMANVISNRKVDSRISVLLLIMQRLHQDDPTGNRLAKKDAGKIRHICLPAEESDGVFPPELKAFYVDGLLDPVRLTKRILGEKLAEMGEFGFSGQYRQNPVPLGGGMFKTIRLNYGIPPAKFKRMARYWDKAGTKDGGAYTVGFLMGLDFNGRFWILDIVRGQWEAAEREKIIKQTAIRDGKGIMIGIEQEPGSGGKESAQATVRRLAGWRVRADKPTGDKALRADPWAVQVNQGNCWVKENAPWITDLLSEMTYFPVSKYKDQVDAGSGAFSALTRVVSVGAI